MKEYSISHLPVFHFLLVLVVCINQLVVLRVIQKLVESVCNSLVLVVVHDVVQARFAVDFLETVDVNLSPFSSSGRRAMYCLSSTGKMVSTAHS